MPRHARASRSGRISCSKAECAGPGLPAALRSPGHGANGAGATSAYGCGTSLRRERRRRELSPARPSRSRSGHSRYGSLPPAPCAPRPPRPPSDAPLPHNDSIPLAGIPHRGDSPVSMKSSTKRRRILRWPAFGSGHAGLGHTNNSKSLGGSVRPPGTFVAAILIPPLPARSKAGSVTARIAEDGGFRRGCTVDTEHRACIRFPRPERHRRLGRPAACAATATRDGNARGPGRRRAPRGRGPRRRRAPAPCRRGGG